MSFSVKGRRRVDEPGVGRLQPEHACSPSAATCCAPGFLAHAGRHRPLQPPVPPRPAPNAGDDAARAPSPSATSCAPHGFSAAFRDGYFLPMVACIWSCPTDQMLQFPVATMIRFCHNHGLIQVHRPAPLVHRGGRRARVRAPHAARASATRGSPRPCARCAASPTACSWPPTTAPSASTTWCSRATATSRSTLLADATRRRARGAGRHPLPRNRAVLHTDAARAAAARSWPGRPGTTNVRPTRRREHASVCLHYLLNRLQPLPFDTPVHRLAEPGARAHGRPPRAREPSTTPTRCSTWPPSPRSAGCRPAGPASARGSAARGRATASTKTA